MAKLKFGESPVEVSSWFLKAPLYHSEDYTFDDCRAHGFDRFRTNIMAIIFPEITIDVYCPSCKRETVFNAAERDADKDTWLSHRGPETRPVILNGIQHAHFKCSRKACESSLYFVFLIADGNVTKVGQSPSIADLLSTQVDKYSKVLGAQLISDWQRALGLRAHGIGAGSYVYLRRIIENMVNAAAGQAQADQKFTGEDYVKARWSERIKMLAGYLPDFLVDNAEVYGVLSKGVHELTEAECADYFDIMHSAIEIMCEEKLADLERKKKAAAGTSAIQKVVRHIAEKKPKPS